MSSRRTEHRRDEDAIAYRRSIAVIGWQVAAVCGALVLAGGLLAIAYVFWQTTPAKLAQANAPDKVRIFLDPLALAFAGLVVGVGAVLCAGVAASIIARRAVRPLDEAYRVQRRFVADASHELRTPVAVLSARAQQLAAMTPVGDPRHPVVEALRNDARIMSGIVDDMLATAAGRSAPAGTSSLASTVDSAVADLRLLADEFEVTVTADLVDAALEVPESVLRRCLVALLDNAIDHSPRGGSVAVVARRIGQKRQDRRDRPGAWHRGNLTRQGLRPVRPRNVRVDSTRRDAHSERDRPGARPRARRAIQRNRGCSRDWPPGLDVPARAPPRPRW